MKDPTELLSVIVSILGLILIGYLAKKAKLLKSNHIGPLSNIIIYLAMPALIFQAVVKSQLNFGFLKITFVSYLVMAASGLVAFLAGRKVLWGPRPYTGRKLVMNHYGSWLARGETTFGAFLLVAMLGNTGYLGYTVTMELYGEGGLVKAFFYDIFGTAIVMFTVGLFIAETYGLHEGKIKKLKEILTFPPLVALVLAIVLNGIQLPSFVSTIVGYLAGATIPLIMIVVGLSLELGEVKNYKFLIFLVCLIKLILAPILGFIGGTALALPMGALKVTVLEASMPSALFSLIIGAKCKLDTKFLPSAIVIATLFSLITISLWQIVLFE